MAHIRKLGKGRWQARYRGPDGRERAKNFPRELEARHFLTTVEASKLRGAWVDPRLGKTPFADFAEQWMASRLNIRGKTRARDEGLIRNHLFPMFGTQRIARITKSDVQKWVAADVAAGFSPATVRKTYSLFGAIMADAVDQKLIHESPCRKVSLPRIAKSERRFLAAQEAERLAQTVPTRFRALIYSAVYLGCRWGELAGLKRAHLDLLRRQVKIVGTIESVGGHYRYVEETKSDAGRRTIKLPTFLIEILARHLETAPESEWVFPATDGGFLRYDNFRNRVWKAAVKEADLEPLTFHELRHTAAALLIDQGADPLQVQRRLGHRDIRTTLGLYGHIFPNREDDLNEALEKVFAGSLADSSRNDGVGEVVAMGGN